MLSTNGRRRRNAKKKKEELPLRAEPSMVCIPHVCVRVCRWQYLGRFQENARVHFSCDREVACASRHCKPRPSSSSCTHHFSYDCLALYSGPLQCLSIANAFGCISRRGNFAPTHTQPHTRNDIDCLYKSSE